MCRIMPRRDADLCRPDRVRNEPPALINNSELFSDAERLSARISSRSIATTDAVDRHLDSRDEPAATRPRRVLILEHK